MHNLAHTPNYQFFMIIIKNIKFSRSLDNNHSLNTFLLSEAPAFAQLNNKII